jgi:hypothetical protein
MKGGDMRVSIELWENGTEKVDNQDVYLSEVDAALVRLACHVDGRRPAVVLHRMLALGLLAFVKDHAARETRTRLKEVATE